MSDTSANTKQPAPVPIRFLGQFIRDLSFEVPHAPEIFDDMRRTAPDIPVSFDIGARHTGGATFEVSINVSLRASVSERPAFILELAYAAMVEVDPRAVSEDQLHPARPNNSSVRSNASLSEAASWSVESFRAKPWPAS